MSKSRPAGARRTRPPLLAALAVAVALAGARAAAAHDLWIEPSGFAPAAGGRISVKLRIGQQFEGDPMPRDPERIVRFAAIGPAGEAPIPGVPGTDPAGYLLPAAPGLYQLVYRSNQDTVELDAGKFEKYLAEEGLEKVLALRARRRESAAPAREIFSRCAKSILLVGGEGGRAGGAPGPGRYDQVLGLPLELVPDRDPYALGAGMELPVTLLFGGRPLAGAKVTAIPKGHAAEQVSARTDARGKARLPLGRGGPWLIKSVHMQPAPAASGAQWESWWASLTFELRGPERAVPAARP
jgi:uncharacterized GH25 family protein